MDAPRRFEIPQDMVAGYGYPSFTEQAKRKLLGENLARLHGLDVAQPRQKLGRKTDPARAAARTAGASE